MTKLNEIIDSLNDEQLAPEIKESMKAEASAMEKRNSQLYFRAKKAEGFEQNSEGEWVKKEVKQEPAQAQASAPSGKPGELDYGQKSFINNVLGVKINDPEQMKLVKDYLDNGKKLDDLVDNKHFKNDLKDIQDNQAGKAAMPTGSGRSDGGSAKDSVDYYLSKGEMPPASQPELRRQYVNEKYKREKNVSHFAK